MTLKTPVGRIRVLLCDHPGCEWKFDAQRYTDRVPTVRAAAAASAAGSAVIPGRASRHWTCVRGTGRGGSDDER